MRGVVVVWWLLKCMAFSFLVLGGESSLVDHRFYMAVSYWNRIQHLCFIRMHSFAVRKAIARTGKRFRTKWAFVWFITSMLIDVKL